MSDMTNKQCVRNNKCIYYNGSVYTETTRFLSISHHLCGDLRQYTHVKNALH